MERSPVPNWLRRLASRPEPPPRLAPSEPPQPPAPLVAEQRPAFATRLAVDSPGGPGRAGAEALYTKWADRWQEF